MNTRSLTTLLAGVAMATTLAAGANATQPNVSVALSYIVDHPAIEATKDGILAVLAEQGFTQGDTMALEVQSAQGNMSTQVQIAQKFAGDTPDLILAISTPSAQASMAAAPDIPVVFAAVTDPLKSGLVASYDRPGGLLSGSSDLTPIDKHVALIQELVPGVERIGVVYNAGEANSVAQIEVLRAEVAAAGLTLVEATAAQSAQVLDAARSLVGRADAIYVPTDSTVVSAIEAVVRVGRDADVPVIAGDTDSVARGAVAALGFDYTDIGRAAGEIAARVLKGESPADIPVAFVDTLELHVNPASADRMGLTLPDALIARASVVVD